MDEIVREYARGEPSAVELVDKLLAEAGVKIDDLVVAELPLSLLERIDRQISIAETRRDASLHEIYRRRARSAKPSGGGKQIEQDDVKLIETAPAGQDQA